MEATEHLIEGTQYRIIDMDGCRQLMVQGKDDAIMSAMWLAAPDRLPMEYTAMMMRGLVFHPQPKDIVLIGLGGGQQANFIYRRMPDTHLVAVEIDPAMVHIARTYFGLPDDERLSVVVGDGAEYIIGQHPDSCDVILSDGYDPAGLIADSLAEEKFYRACYLALRDGGFIAINLFRRDKSWCAAHMHMLSGIFASFLSVAVSDEQSILFAFKTPPFIDCEALAEVAERMEERFQLGLPDFVRSLADLSRTAF